MIAKIIHLVKVNRVLTEAENELFKAWLLSNRAVTIDNSHYLNFNIREYLNAIYK